MARSDQGDDLSELKLQAGSVFTKTRRGLDKGTRSWIIDTAQVVRKAPDTGDADAVFKTMFVDQVEVKALENGVSLITAQYLGLISKKGKADDIQEDADTEAITRKPKQRQRLVQYMRPIPRVTVTYVRAKKEPIMLVGIPKIPPLDFSGTKRGKGYHEEFTDEGAEILYEGWILKSRSIRTAGSGTDGTIFEMTDVYTYEQVVAPAETYAMDPQNIDPQKKYWLRGSTLKALLTRPKGAKGEINIRTSKDGEVIISFAQKERFKVVRNGVIMVFEMPAQEVD